jgi:hypothetical protein
MKIKLLIAALCTAVLGGCTFAVTDGWHDHGGYRPYHYHWNDGWRDGPYRRY